MKQISTEKEIKKMSAQNIEVYRLDDGRFAFMGRIYEDKQALDEEIESYGKFEGYANRNSLSYRENST